MKILWFTWKDLKHPQAGGAEMINEEIAKRLVRDGHEVVLIVSGFPSGIHEEGRDGYSIIRLGNRYTVYWHAYRYYKHHLSEWADLVVDEMNTVPFFVKYYVKERNILFVYQLCRKIWFYQMPQPLSSFGYLLEALYLRLLNDRSVITESRSTKEDLLCYGFDGQKIGVISVGITLQPVSEIRLSDKFPVPTLLSLGAMRNMKRTLDQIKAYEIAKKNIPGLQLKVAGSVVGRYGAKVLDLIKKSPYASDIEYLGMVDEARKAELMRKSHVIMVTSVKEGWGLIVTEANSQGTPAVVYNVDGLRDSVKHEVTGLVCSENTPRSLAESLTRLLTDKTAYDRMRQNGWSWSRELTFERCYNDFVSEIRKNA